jgi:hypothetical protein
MNPFVEAVAVAVVVVVVVEAVAVEAVVVEAVVEEVGMEDEEAVTVMEDADTDADTVADIMEEVMEEAMEEVGVAGEAGGPSMDGLIAEANPVPIIFSKSLKRSSFLSIGWPPLINQADKVRSLSLWHVV